MLARCLILFVLALITWCVPRPASASMFTLDAQGGQQSNRFAWSIAGFNGRPNVLSELAFKSTANKGRLLAQWTDDTELFFLKVSLGYGEQFYGRILDDDFAADNRQGQFSHSQSTIGGNSIQDYVGDLGIRMIRTDRILFGYTVGYRYDFQSYRITAPAAQILPPVNVDFSQLNSMYNVHTMGFIVGIFGGIELRPLPLSISFKAHYGPSLEYRGRGYWNLRAGPNPSDFQQNPSFEHNSRAKEGDVDLSLQLKLSERWHSTVGWQAMWWKVKAGSDTTFFNDGSTPAVPFNGADLRSQFFYVGLGYRWG